MKVVFSKGNVTGRWSWTLYSSNGQVLARSRAAMLGYTHKSDAIKAFTRIRKIDYIQGIVEDSQGNTKTCYGL